MLFKRDIPFGTIIAQAYEKAGVELKSTIDVTRVTRRLHLSRAALA